MGKTKYHTVRNVTELNRILRRLNELPREASIELRDESKRIAGDVADEARMRALSGTGGVARVAKHVAPTIRATRDRVPVIRMGGNTMLPARNGQARAGALGNGMAGPRNPLNQTVGAVMWGAEYGSGKSTQFSPWGGNDTSAGYFLWPSIRMDEIIEQWSEGVLRAFDRVSR